MITIVLTTDFSEHAHNAGKYAIHLAQKIDAKLSLFHAYHVPVIDPMTPAEYLKELSDSVKKEAENKLEEEQRKLQEYAGKIGFQNLKIKTKASFGFAVGEILSFIKSEKADLLVMGARHIDGLEQAIFGSVNQPILEKASVPVLLVPKTAKFSDESPNVLYASDFNENDEDAVSTLLGMVAPIEGKVHCVHFNIDGFVNVDRADMEALQDKFKSEKAKGYIDFEIVDSENLEDGMNSYIKDRRIDMVAMLTQKRSFFESLLKSSNTKAMASRTDIPLIAFQSE